MNSTRILQALQIGNTCVTKFNSQTEAVVSYLAANNEVTDQIIRAADRMTLVTKVEVMIKLLETQATLRVSGVNMDIFKQFPYALAKLENANDSCAELAAGLLESAKPRTFTAEEKAFLAEKLPDAAHLVNALPNTPAEESAEEACEESPRIRLC